MSDPNSHSQRPNLDEVGGPQLRDLAHRMLDDMLDYTLQIRKRPVWVKMQDQDRDALHGASPVAPTALAQVYDQFQQRILPFAIGNVHPGFMGWVHGGGTIVGLLAEMLAAGLNANCGGRDHSPIQIEQEIVEWSRQWFGFPAGTSGLFVTGGSMANFVAVLVARRATLGAAVRGEGLSGQPRRLIAYTSAAAHACIGRAMDYAGLGSRNLRLIPFDAEQRVSLPALREAISADRSAGHLPFLLIGNAGTVDIGAIDDLAALADLAAAQDLWFHVDGAFGALGVLAPEIAPCLAGIERADSLALDFHKWMQVPYDAGFVLVRDGILHRETFATVAAYLHRGSRGVAAGEYWPNDFGPDLSRAFRALKTWFTLRVYGTQQLGAVIADSCRVARYLQGRIKAEPRLELLAPVPLNIVCFRYRAADADTLNEAIVADVQESGVALPSTTRIDGRLAIRAAIFNHRTQERDVDTLLQAVLEHGDRRTSGRP
jgi:glutamate/tyrosine decarboxylase-like PLP-dependent enzyme